MLSVLPVINNLQIRDIRSLQVFRTVAEAKGISAAQERLGMTQSNISTLILELEGRLGVTLCERGRGGFRLTAEGEQVYATTGELQADLSIYRDRLQSIGGGLKGKLSLGHMDSYLGHPENPLVKALSTLTREAPGIELALCTAPLEELETGVAKGDLQLAIGTFTQKPDGLQYQHLHNEAQGLFCSSGHPLANTEHELTVDEVKTTGYAAGLFGYGKESSLLQNRVATVHQIESMLVFLLTARGIGGLPVHVAAPYVARGQLVQLMPQTFSMELPVSIVLREQSLSSPLVTRCLGLLGATEIQGEQRYLTT
jgi:DNA-binding transcriptional LysR family regulator